MVHGKSRAEVAAHLDEIRALLGDALRGADVLYSTRILKKTGLRLRDPAADPSARPPRAAREGR